MAFGRPEPHISPRVRALDAMRKRAKREKRVDDVIVAFLVVIILVGMLLVSPWLLMLLFGAIHHSLTTVVPAYGYGASMLIVITVAAIKGLVEVFRG